MNKKEQARFHLVVTGGPDGWGRSHFTAYWCEPTGVFRPEWEHGMPVGYLRAQEGFSDLTKYQPPHVVYATGGEAKKTAAKHYLTPTSRQHAIEQMKIALDGGCCGEARKNYEKSLAWLEAQ